MKCSEIYDFDDLKAYCKKRILGVSYITPHPTSPSSMVNIKVNNAPMDYNVLGVTYSNNSNSLNYRLFEDTIYYYNVGITGILFSYNTPIGLITDNTIFIISRDTVPFNSVTAKRIITMLNRNMYKLPSDRLKFILQEIGIDLGWLK